MGDLQIAVLYQIGIYNEKTGVYFFKPLDVVEGIVDQQNNTFLDETNTEGYFLDDAQIILKNSQFCIGNVLDENKIQEKYPNVKNIEEAKQKLLEESNQEIILGVFYNKKIELIRLLTPQSQQFEALLDKRNLDNPYYQNLKSGLQIEDYDFTIFPKKVIDYMLSSNDLEDIKKNMTYFLIYKNSYQKIVELQETVTIIDDEELCNMILIDDINEIKNAIQVRLKQPLEQYGFQNLNDTNLTLQEFLKYAYNLIITSDSVEALKNYLNRIQSILESILEQIKKYQLEKRDYELCNKTINIILCKIKSILAYNHTLDDAIYNYKNMYQDMTNLISHTNQILTSKNLKISQRLLEQLELIQTEDKPNELKNQIEEEIKFDYNECYQYLTSHLIGRRKQIGSILSMIDRVDSNKNEDKKTCGIIVGKGGVGKTQTFKSLRKIMPNRPITITDTNQLTSAGYVGGTIENNILADLIQKAHAIHEKDKNESFGIITEADVLLAERGIVFLDEIDKRKSNEANALDVNGSGVVNELLKMMDGTIYQVPIGNQIFQFDTSKLVIFAGGAFQEYFEFQNKTIGYQQENDLDQFKKFLEINPEKLIEYGLSSQFIGRCSRICLYPDLTKEEFITLEKNKKTSFLQNRVELFQQKKVSLVWEEEFFEDYIEEAMKLNTGARGLDRVLNRYTDNAYEEICKRPNEYKAIYLGKEAIEHPENVVLLTTENECILMESILKKNQEEEKTLIEINPVEPDSTYLQFFQQEKVKKHKL